MWTPDQLKKLRERMNLSKVEFAKLLGVEARTVARWENGTARPTGAAEAFLSGLREKLHKDPSQADEVCSDSWLGLLLLETIQTSSRCLTMAPTQRAAPGTRCH